MVSIALRAILEADAFHDTLIANDGKSMLRNDEDGV